MSKITEVSRDAQVVAYCLFCMGGPTSATFQRPHAIHQRTRAGLDELTMAGLLEPVDPKTLPRTAMGWKATEAMGMPMRDFDKFGIPAITEDDTFPITTD
jgi:hypothetical protein